MIDCGSDWLGQLPRIGPTAIVLTHAHADHAAGLVKGAPCPVYATKTTLALLRGYPIHDRRRIPLHQSGLEHLPARPVRAPMSLVAIAVGSDASNPVINEKLSWLIKIKAARLSSEETLTLHSGSD